MDVVEHEGEVGVGLAFVHLVEGVEETLVEFVVSDDKQGVVGQILDDVGVDHQARGSSVENDVVIVFAQLGDEFLEAAVAEQLGGVGRDGAGEDAVDSRVDEVGFDNRVPIVDLACQQVGEAGVFARIESASQRAFAQVEVEDDGFLACDAEARCNVGGYEGLTHAGEQGGDHEHLAAAVFVAGAEEVNLGAQQSEGFRHGIVVVVGDHHLAVVVLLAGGDFAEEWHVGDAHDVAVVLHLGVEQTAQEEDAYGDGQTYEETHQGGFGLVGCYRGAVDASRVEDFAVGFDGRTADHQLFASA